MNARLSRSPQAPLSQGAATGPPATQKQVDFVLDLGRQLRELAADNDDRNTTVNAFGRIAADARDGKLTVGQASELLDSMLDTAKEWRADRTKAPVAASPAVDVPAGRYAVEGDDGELKFYRVDRPTEGRWAGYTFVQVQAGDDLHRLPSRSTEEGVLRKIAADVRAAAIRYGREIGRCSSCGRTLTNNISRELGIGPVCGARLLGDGFRSEVKEARTSLQARGIDPDANYEPEADDDSEDAVAERVARNMRGGTDVRAQVEANFGQPDRYADEQPADVSVEEEVAEATREYDEQRDRELAEEFAAEAEAIAEQIRKEG